MKIHFDNANLRSTTGPNSFASRLAKELFNTGHTVVDKGGDADVSLVFIEPSGQQLARRVVQRLDGIWFKPDEFATRNAKIKALYHVADAVIWQSEFDRGMTNHWWDYPRSGRVIHNGIEHKQPPENSAMKRLRTAYNKVFVAASNWHPQKRLRSNVEMFFHLKNSFPNSCLIVMGMNPDCYVPNPDIYYTGSLAHEDCLSVYAVADWMLHLAWLDHCPNVVIEALSQNVPVICAASGGTPELVKQFGIVVAEQKPYAFELADYDAPPTIDVTSVLMLPDRTTLGPHIDINISSVAKKYIEVFESLQ